MCVSESVCVYRYCFYQHQRVQSSGAESGLWARSLSLSGHLCPWWDFNFILFGILFGWAESEGSKSHHTFNIAHIEGWGEWNQDAVGLRLGLDFVWGGWCFVYSPMWSHFRLFLADPDGLMLEAYTRSHTHTHEYGYRYTSQYICTCSYRLTLVRGNKAATKNAIALPVECWLLGTRDKRAAAAFSRYSPSCSSSCPAASKCRSGDDGIFRIKFMKVKCFVIDVIKYLWQRAAAVPHGGTLPAFAAAAAWEVSAPRRATFWQGSASTPRLQSDWWPKLTLSLIDINYLKGFHTLLSSIAVESESFPSLLPEWSGVIEPKHQSGQKVMLNIILFCLELITALNSQSLYLISNYRNTNKSYIKTI